MKTVKIKGMRCNHCAMAVTKALRRIEGVTDVDVDLERGEARFAEAKPVSLETIRAQIRAAGYDLE